jgi:hypothetical protein
MPIAGIQKTDRYAVEDQKSRLHKDRNAFADLAACRICRIVGDEQHAANYRDRERI